MGADSTTGLSEMDRLYEKYGTPFEAEHWGEFLAISPRGETLLAPTLVDAFKQAVERFGPGNYLFKVGEKVVGAIRSPRLVGSPPDLRQSCR